MCIACGGGASAFNPLDCFLAVVTNVRHAHGSWNQKSSERPSSRAMRIGRRAPHVR